MPSACSMPMPERAVSASTSAKMPTGATHSTQPTITIIASLMVLKKPTTCARGAASMRVSANPKNSANVTSGSIAPAAAAATALLGMIAVSALAQPPVTAGSSASWPRRAAATAGSGCSIDKAIGASTAVMIAAAVNNTRKMMMALRATRPDWATSVAWFTPTITSDSTSGTTVICSALIHNFPNGSTIPATLPASTGSSHASRMPTTMPATRPAITRLVWLIG